MKQLKTGDIITISIPALKCLPNRSVHSKTSYINGTQHVELKAPLLSKKKTNIDRYKQIQNLFKQHLRTMPNEPYSFVLVKYVLGSIGKSIPPHAMKANWFVLKNIWHNRVNDACDTRELMAAELVLESYIKFEALQLWWKKFYIACYEKVRKISGANRFPSIHGAATLMANPTLPILMSRILALDKGIDYEIKNRKRSSVKKQGQKSRKKPKKIKKQAAERFSILLD